MAAIEAPVFATLRQYRARLGDLDLWRPVVAAILARHDLAGPDREPIAGYNPTYPTFICGDMVVKLFGFVPNWRTAHAAERAALALVTTDPRIAAPRLLAEGRLCDDDDAPWPYLVGTRMAGVAWRNADLHDAQRRSLAVELGRQLRLVHALPTAGIVIQAAFLPLDVTEAAGRSSLPPHLVAQVDGFLARLGPVDPVFVHADLCAMHVFVENGHLAGIIDWGDAIVADRHYELIQLYRDLFACDKTLLRLFLDGYGWPIGPDFPRMALGQALYRQAIGLVQHPTMDVFEPIAARLPLHEIATLDELATLLFAV